MNDIKLLFLAEFVRACPTPRSVDLLLIGGLPGSGKTYLATEVFQDRVRFNLDTMRADYWRMAYRRELREGDYNASPVDVLASNERALIDYHLVRGHKVVVDNTMLRREWRKPYARIATKHRRTCGMLFLDMPWSICEARMRDRAADSHVRVPDDVLAMFREQVVLPTMAEGYTRVWIARSNEELAELLR